MEQLRKGQQWRGLRSELSMTKHRGWRRPWSRQRKRQEQRQRKRQGRRQRKRQGCQQCKRQGRRQRKWQGRQQRKRQGRQQRKRQGRQQYKRQVRQQRKQGQHTLPPRLLQQSLQREWSKIKTQVIFRYIFRIWWYQGVTVKESIRFYKFNDLVTI